MLDPNRPAQPRLRVLAGPNGSGKSTIKSELKPQWLGAFVNADEIERNLKNHHGQLSLRDLNIVGPRAVVSRRLIAAIKRSPFAKKLGLDALADTLSLDRDLTLRIPAPHDSYQASVLADAIRRVLLAQRSTFTFETVMSSRDKVDFMREARQQGYRVYLYFVATDDPDINIDRVRRRVAQGGHPVPDEKVRKRYVESIRLMSEACDVAHRAFIFDNSGTRHRLVAEVLDGTDIKLTTSRLPPWFVQTDLWRST